jgi:hypothetical protein
MLVTVILALMALTGSVTLGAAAAAAGEQDPMCSTCWTGASSQS